MFNLMGLEDDHKQVRLLQKNAQGCGARGVVTTENISAISIHFCGASRGSFFFCFSTTNLREPYVILCGFGAVGF